MGNSTTKTLTLSLAVSLALTAGPALAKQVLVQFDQPAAARYAATQRQQGIEVGTAELQARRDTLAAQQDDFLAALSGQGIDHTVQRFEIPDLNGGTASVTARYTLVMNGIALDVPESAIATIESMPEVRDVHPVRMYRTRLDNSVPYTGAPALYGDVAEVTPFDNFNEGLEGQGVTVSVIDTGIEWSHEMFGADATPPRLGLQPPNAAVDTNEKVTYYLPLFDGVVDTFGHGTHVASTAAGYQGFAPGPDGIPLTADDVAMHGMAPQARLMGYQVCNGVGSASGTAGCLSTAIILAIEDSVAPRTLTGFPKPQADVINLSLGGAGGPDDATAQAADNAVLLGTSVVAAAGNDGPADGTVGSPAAGRHVIAVGASNDPGVFPNRIDVVGGAFDPIIASMSADSNAGQPLSDPITGQYVFAGLADTPEQVPLSVAGNICLVQRGSTAEAADNGTGLFTNKAAQCESKGAIATVIFNNAPGEIGPVLAPATRPVFTISGRDGQLLLDLGFDASGVSEEQIRLGPRDPSLFAASMAGFSSRGPVQGLGQIKPDVAAPGVSVMAATTPLGVPVLSMQSETRYTEANGTSMASPHVAGAAAQLRQAHLDWSAAMIRTALINTATNPRDGAGNPQANGPGTDSILAQGGGIIDVKEAAQAKALMGVAGDGIVRPEILGSHSFGAVPAVNSRTTHTEQVQVHIRDLSGEGGTYDLSVANNRDLQLDGIDVAISPASVTVPADGTASFTVQASVDGDAVRDTFAAKSFGNQVFFERIQMQWFVRAERDDGAESLRMPFYLKPTDSVPAQVQSAQGETFSDTMPASDLGNQLVEDVTFKDFEVDVTRAAFNLVGDLTFDELAGGLPDLDLFLFAPGGEEIDSSTTAGGPEHIATRVDQPGTYTFRVVGWASAATDFDLEVVQELGGEPPMVDALAGDFINSNGQPVDFDGDLQLTWMPVGNPQRFEIERSVDGGPFEVVANVDAETTSITLADQPEGELAFRVKALFPGQIGFFVSAPSAEREVVVDRRERVTITDSVDTTVSNVALSSDEFSFDLTLTNEAGQDFLPLVDFEIVEIDSASGTVEVINADNGGSGLSPSDPALFGYSNELGEDDTFSAGETSASRHLRFADPESELFTFNAIVTAHVASGDGQNDNGATGNLQGTSADGGNGNGDNGPSGSGALLQFTVNPALGIVDVALLDGML